MTDAPFDSSARGYAPFVRAVRRLSNGAAAAPKSTTLAATAEWLVRGAGANRDFMRVLEELIWRITAAGLPLHRVTAHVGTLHPQVCGFGWVWEAYDGHLDEILVEHQSLSSPSFTKNPLARVIDHGETVRVRLTDPKDAARFPITETLAEQGLTDYLARPIGGAAHGAPVYNAMTMATTQVGGFSTQELEELEHIFDLFALHIERHIAERIAQNVLTTYLGASAGGKVLQGTVARGAGERIRAVIWISDLRGFTDRSDQLSAEEVSALMNVYFEALAGAVMSAGGEVLKFIGDGLLAVFPIKEDRSELAAAAAIDAVRDAGRRIDALNAAPPAVAPSSAFPLKSGIALHLGDVFFGNVGSADRLDFTVIGSAVNAASRVEALTKPLDRSVLISEPVAKLSEAPMEDLGSHRLRGVEEAMRIFALAEA